MFRSLKNSRRGFTLIEVLVVIAIIGILSSVVLASLSIARMKSRDAKRIAELGQLALALELYFDVNQSYPSTTPVGYSGADAAVQFLTTLNFLPPQQLPPVGSEPTYLYHGVNASGECLLEADGICTSYAIGSTLERSDNVVLDTDGDQTVGTVFYGSGSTCLASGGTEQCFDVKP
jgi:prepilin-type N-terminal cleavage/methylation domain-containing protein